MTKLQVFDTLMGIPTGVNLFLTEDGKEALLNLVDIKLIREDEKIKKVG